MSGLTAKKPYRAEMAEKTEMIGIETDERIVLHIVVSGRSSSWNRTDLVCLIPEASLPM
jgi:hypothetical protein